MVDPSSGGGAPGGHAISVLLAERARRVFGERVAVALAVCGSHEGCNNLDVPVVDLARLAPEVGEPEIDIELEQVDSAWAPRHAKSVEMGSDNMRWKARCE